MQVYGFRGFTFLFFLAAATFILFSNFTTPIALPGNGGDNDPTTLIPVAVSRKLKENERKSKKEGSWVAIDDYGDASPVPAGAGDSSSLKPAPIGHGTPLRPYIPRAPPPPAIYY
ncbi:hypothetical protein PIB30_019396 [Stylosanthes scabra]|uniref:Uncharacterized protein n=1 Tax=Stylosanthes scabra TaxID=79078 RepID=A0ABU6Z4W1_9FABA|nr:hypothetical protein [Stylosanthes scabra]